MRIRENLKRLQSEHLSILQAPSSRNTDVPNKLRLQNNLGANANIVRYCYKNIPTICCIPDDKHANVRGKY